ncbi:glycosyltransferase [Undibacterium squillarum]|uniref:Glycosyltransferase 2-like domain-containing protein n=1 Tax=Undibacterium squillarum TaxID=1131567 RepID=A0ABQ2XVS4_9BURK|nr:glycosyltransferase [Undibacterium squillarum]GGX36504.1 hypothetical protein GCM10010946_12890 [Undibacterium squillarum]
MNNQIDVVIIGRNEAKHLARCIASVRASNGVQLGSIIYVDSDSADDSCAIATRAGCRLVSLQSGRMSAARARNAGFSLSDAGYVMFLDGDTVLHPDFLAQASQAMQGSVAVVWGHRRELAPHSSWYIRMLDMDWIYAPGETAFCGGDALFRRSALLQSGGFCAELIAGEEPELCARIRAGGGTILHADIPMTLHDLGIHSFAAYWKRAIRAGHAYAEVSGLCRRQGRELWRHEVQKNYLRALQLPLLLAAAVASCLQPHALLMLILLLAMPVRAVLRCRYKSGSVWIRAQYILHSYLQLMAIAAGQSRFYLMQRCGVRSRLIEYRSGGDHENRI